MKSVCNTCTINFCEMKIFFNWHYEQEPPYVTHFQRQHTFFISTQLFIKNLLAGRLNSIEALLFIVTNIFTGGSNIFSAILEQLNLQCYSKESWQSLKTRLSTLENFEAPVQFRDVRGHSRNHWLLSSNFRDKIRLSSLEKKGPFARFLTTETNFTNLKNKELLQMLN